MSNSPSSSLHSSPASSPNSSPVSSRSNSPDSRTHVSTHKQHHVNNDNDNDNDGDGDGDSDSDSDSDDSHSENSSDSDNNSSNNSSDSSSEDDEKEEKTAITVGKRRRRRRNHNTNAQWKSTAILSELDSEGRPIVIKERKPYTMTKAREIWTKDEHQTFLKGIQIYGRKWKKIKEYMNHKKTLPQIRSHAQKYTMKQERIEVPVRIPPPRPKNKCKRPYPRSRHDPTNTEGLKKLNANHRQRQFWDQGTNSKCVYTSTQPTESNNNNNNNNSNTNNDTQHSTTQNQIVTTQSATTTKTKKGTSIKQHSLVSLHSIITPASFSFPEQTEPLSKNTKPTATKQRKKYKSQSSSSSGLTLSADELASFVSSLTLNHTSETFKTFVASTNTMEHEIHDFTRLFVLQYTHDVDYTTSPTPLTRATSDILLKLSSSSSS